MLTAYKGWFTTTTTLGPMSDEQAAAALSQYGSPEIVANAIKVLNEWRSQGKLPGGSVTFGEIELRVDGVQATARECRDGSTEVTIDANTGEIIGKGKPGQLALATLTKKTGSWLMYSFEATKNAC